MTWQLFIQDWQLHVQSNTTCTWNLVRVCTLINLINLTCAEGNIYVPHNFQRMQFQNCFTQIQNSTPISKLLNHFCTILKLLRNVTQASLKREILNLPKWNGTEQHSVLDLEEVEFRGRVRTNRIVQSNTHSSVPSIKDCFACWFVLIYIVFFKLCCW